MQLYFYEVSRIGKSMERMKVDLWLPGVWVWVGWALLLMCAWVFFLWDNGNLKLDDNDG